jgi:hypothetical protein
MNMIQKMYDCVLPLSDAFGERSVEYRYQVSAWMAMGSNTVNITTRDESGWARNWPDQDLFAVSVEKLSDYINAGVKTMDDLIEYLFYVVKA